MNENIVAVEALAKVLAEHAYNESTSAKAAHCSCGMWLLGNSPLTHRHHVAVTVLASGVVVPATESQIDFRTTDRLLIVGGNPGLAERIREINCTCGHGPEPAEIHVWDCPYWDRAARPSPCDAHDDVPATGPAGLTEEQQALRSLWRDLADSGIEHGVDWPMIVRTLFRDLDDALAARVPARTEGRDQWCACGCAYSDHTTQRGMCLPHRCDAPRPATEG